MNRKLINGLLLLTLATGGVGSFTSCKDTEEDFRNQVLVGQGDLKGAIEALRKLTDTEFVGNLDAEINRLINEAAEQGKWNEVATLITKVGTLEGQYSTLQNQVNGLEAAWKEDDELMKQAILAQVSGDLTNLQQTITTAYQSYTDNAVGNLNTEITSKFNDVNNRFNTIDSQISGILANQKEDSITANKALGLAQANAEALRAVEKKVANVSDSLKQIYSDFDVVATDVTKLKSDVADLLNSNENIINVLGEHMVALEQLQNDYDSARADLINHENRIGQLEFEMASFQTAVESWQGELMDKLAHMITSITVNRVVSPVFGSLNLPIDVSSRVLFDYLFNSDHAIEFPALSGNAFAKQEFDPENGKYVDVAALNPKVFKFGTGDGMQLDNLGYVYVTVNPANVNFDGVKASLVNSMDEQVLAELKLEKVNDEVLTFGFTRADIKNGLYKAKVVPTEGKIGEDVAKIAVEAEPGLKTAIKDAIKNHTMSDFTQLAKLLVKQFDGVLPAYAVKVEYKDKVQDENGMWVETMNSVRSDYDMAATTFRPLSYSTGFGFGTDREPLPTFGHVGYYIDKFFNGLDLSFQLTGLDGVGTLDSVKIDLGNVKFEMKDMAVEVQIPSVDVKLPNNLGTGKTEPTTVTLGYHTDANGNVIFTNPDDPDDKNYAALKNLVEELSKAVNDLINGEGDNSLSQQINDQINEQILNQVNAKLTDLNGQLAGLNGQIEDNIQNIVDNIKDQLNGKLGRLDKVIDKYNQFANKINDMLKNPNHYLQIMMLYNTKNNGVHRLSTVATDPTRFGGNGVALDLYATSFNAEIAVPSYKKYVAITGVYSWQNGKLVKENANLTELNGNYGNSSLNQVLKGEQQHVIVPTSKMQKGKVYEIYYTSLDYRGFTSSQKYYVTL